MFRHAAGDESSPLEVLQGSMQEAGYSGGAFSIDSALWTPLVRHRLALDTEQFVTTPSCKQSCLGRRDDEGGEGSCGFPSFRISSGPKVANQRLL